MGSERGLGSRPSEPKADGLAVGAHPRPLPGGSRLRACTGRRPLPLGRPPTRARPPASLLLASGARRGPASARGRSDNVLSGFSLRIHRTGRYCRLPWGCPLDVTPGFAGVPPLPHPKWRKKSCGSGQ